MKFQITQKNLSKCLQDVTPFTDKGHQLELIKNIRLKTNKNLLEITATNLDTFIVEKIAGSCKEEGEITVPGTLFRDYIQSLSAADSQNKPSTVELSLDKNKLNLNCQGKQASINCLPAGDFPEFPIDKKSQKPILSLQASDLKEMLSQVVFAAPKDITRPVLTSVLFYVFENKFYLVATDSYRLAERHVDKLSNKKSINDEVQILISANTLISLEKILISHPDSQISIYKEDDKRCVLFVIDDGDIEIVSSLMEGVYPDYRKLIPEHFTTQIIVNKQDLIEASKRTRLFSQEISPSIILSWSEDSLDQLQIKSSTSQIGENEETIEAKIETKPSKAKSDKKPDHTITLNVKYLQEVLSVLKTDQLILHINGKLEPCIIKEFDNGKVLEHYRHAIMPLKS